ncbi:uncharacterized protein B0H18DRAFT_1122579 [Fomitopsis serialis]|uniref:uncharacterized protein n=1 Tax=Fomitopsis serialis TaxID=139415 RepID=UPI002007D7BC|nr:uncharacterized protein B0H18DRAFT_1122579 [Neoantrodia serialis]KAH9919327.1 hypothetical protein B0H18DRAFT_1122579 [Neoantrodia serialis]
MADYLPGYPRSRGGYFGAAHSHASDDALMEELYTEPVAVVEKPTNITDDDIAIAIKTWNTSARIAGSRRGSRRWSCQAPQQPPTPDVNSLASNLSAMSMKSGEKRGFDVDRDASTAELDVIRAAVPVNGVKYDWVGTYPQLYFSQTQWRYLAVHNQGNFTEVRKRALDDPEMKRIEAKLRGDFKKLRSALRAIQDLVVEHGDRGRLSLVFEDSTLRVFGRKTQESCLPDTMLRRFEGL